MRHMEISRKTIQFGEAAPSTLVYYITIDSPPGQSGGTELEIYGVGVTIVESGETAIIRNVTLRQDDIIALAELLACHLVTPVTAADVVADWVNS